LLHEIEANVLTRLESTRQHRKRVLDLLRAPPDLDYPRDGRPAFLEGRDLVPVVFQAIEEAWRRTSDVERNTPTSMAPNIGHNDARYADLNTHA
jgi:hypothetical protein